MKTNSVAVVGGGIFGITVAVKLAQHGFKVDLFEKNNDILSAASGINQFRLHRGYHYPRSPKTIASCLDAEPKFKQEYSDAIIEGNTHYYCVAKEKSKTSRDEFLARLKEFGLEHTEEYPGIINKEQVNLCVRAKENLINISKLKQICKTRLNQTGVNVKLNTRVSNPDLQDYDYSVFATYANLNSSAESSIEYQYELCEKLVLQLPKEYKNKSVVIMDGPFMCIDPFGNTGNFLMGNVVHAIHNRNIGKYPEIPDGYENLLNKGVIKNPPITNFDKFIESASQFFKGIKKARHLGSMYTFRTVLPDKEKTDERPTLVNKINDNTFTVFSGKIGNCVQAAEDILQTIERSDSKVVSSPDSKFQLP